MRPNTGSQINTLPWQHLESEEAFLQDQQPTQWITNLPRQQAALNKYYAKFKEQKLSKDFK